MKNIKCIVFDWGGVLIDNPTEDFAIECAKRLSVKSESFKKAYAEFAFRFERGLIEETILWEKMSSNLNTHIEYTNSLWYDCFKKVYSPRDEVFSFAKKLKNSDFTVALLSNTEFPALKFFNEQNYDMFDYKVFSCKEGEAKPEPQLYKILLDKINIPAEQTVFIDDKLENIETANRINMNGIQFINNYQVMAELQRFNISV